MAHFKITIGIPGVFLHIVLQSLPPVAAVGAGLGGLWDPCPQAIPNPCVLVPQEADGSPASLNDELR